MNLTKIDVLLTKIVLNTHTSLFLIIFAARIASVFLYEKMMWFCCTFEGTDLATLAHLESTFVKCSLCSRTLALFLKIRLRLMNMHSLFTPISKLLSWEWATDSIDKSIIFKKMLAFLAHMHFLLYLCTRNQMKTVKTLHFDFISVGVSSSVSFVYAYNRAFVWHPKTAILRWLKWRHFHADFRPFSPLFFSIFQPIFGCSQNSVRGSLTNRLALD